MPKQLTDSNHKPTREEIARRAYEIFEQSGRVPGRDMQNWLQAEAQLNGARNGTATKASPARPATRATANH